MRIRRRVSRYTLRGGGIWVRLALLLALAACPGCSSPACAGPAAFPPSVFVHAEQLFANHPGASARVCASGCRTLTAQDDGGDLGQQLVAGAADEHPLIALTATVTIPGRHPVDSTLGTQLTKRVVEGICGDVQYLADVHLDSGGHLELGRS